MRVKWKYTHESIKCISTLVFLDRLEGLGEVSPLSKNACQRVSRPKVCTGKHLFSDLNSIKSHLSITISIVVINQK